MLESKPSQSEVFPPTFGTQYKVRTGDSWKSIAKANGLGTWTLIKFNFPVVRNASDFQTMCRQVNWLLRNHVGCTMTADGMNYRFDSADTPGVIYIPRRGYVSPRSGPSDLSMDLSIMKLLDAATP
jgi:hypothetical protein